MAKTIAACFAVLLAIFEVGSCIKCYQCNSQSDKTCADPFKPGTQSVDCATQDSIKYNQLYLYNILPAEVFGTVPGSPRYCHKITMESGTTIRTCLDGSPADMNHTCRTMEMNSKTSTPDRKIKSCSVCDKENCNAAVSLSFSVPLAIATLAASYLLYKQ